jgi:hypothetical protein
MLDQFEAKQRYQDYQREVAQIQLYQQVQAGQVNPYQRLLLRLGSMLISAGQYLRRDSHVDVQSIEPVR